MSIPQADAGKHPNPVSHPFSKLRSKVDNLTSDLSRLGVAVKTTWNPNHRHDEEWEQEVDRKMEAIRDGHRFRSFAGERDGNVVKWHIDGHGVCCFIPKSRRHMADGRLLLGLIRTDRFRQRGDIEGIRGIWLILRPS